MRHLSYSLLFQPHFSLSYILTRMIGSPEPTSIIAIISYETSRLTYINKASYSEYFNAIMYLELSVITLLLSVFSFIFGVSATHSSPADFATACYNPSLPSTIPSTANRTIPWGTPSFTYRNGSMCCSSLDQIRIGIDDIDNKLLRLLSQR